jgi:hypothetical protein
MQRVAIIGFACLWTLAACASARGIDRPVQLPPDYAAREASASKPADRCGPEFISDNAPAAAVALLGPMFDGPFRPVCARHDACYELREQTQAWCDQRMRTEMLDICAVGRPAGSPGAALCRVRAGLYFDMVDSNFGAYSYHGAPGGEITAVDVAAAPAGKVNICVTAANTTPLLQEYIVELRTERGARKGRAPGLAERSVRAGESTVLCASLHGAALAKGPHDAVLIADDPDQLALSNDHVEIDRRRIDASSAESAARD